MVSIYERINTFVLLQTLRFS